MADVRVASDLGTLSLRAAESAAGLINDAVRATGRCSVVLSGGSTPRVLYSRWASQFAQAIPWADVHVFWGDERFVPPDHRDSNYRLAKETLLDHVPCPAANIHPVPTGLETPELAATGYEATLRGYFRSDSPRFDLVLLGLGPEGHTASLFPQSPALVETARWVLPVTAPADPPLRVTLTLPALNVATHIYFLVAGASKAAALQQVLTGTADARTYPAAGVKPEGHGVIWWVDSEAAGQRIEK
jgi:6-phosphogluconolactonase